MCDYKKMVFKDTEMAALTMTYFLKTKNPMTKFNSLNKKP